MIVTVGEKMHVVRRRKFVDDPRRHFAGEVTEIEGLTVRVEGYAFVYDANTGEFFKKPGKKTTFFTLGDSGYIINIIPVDVDIERLAYDNSKGRLVVTDHGPFSLDVNEFGVNR